MVQIDWDRIRAVKAVSLTDDEIEDLFPMVIRCEIEEVDDIFNLRSLMKLSQEMLQFKDNQVESLLLECGEMKEKLSSSKKVNKGEVNERDKSESKIRNSYATDDNYADSLQLKNDKIKHLMLELEGLETENMELKGKLDTLKGEMEDATESMNEMADELNNLRGRNIMLKDEVDHLKQEKKALLNQIEEIAAQQLDRDKIIDEFGAAIDIRVSEWKDILDGKNNEIVQLKNELSKFQLHPTISMNTQNTSQIVYLNEEIDKRDKIIGELESKLREASIEITDSAELIEKLKLDMRQMEKSGRRKEQRDLLKKIQDANEKISILQLSLNEVEDNLTAKSQQLCEVLADLKRYEDKDHGLADTIAELKELKKQLSSKNDHIQKIVMVINKLEALNSHQEMQIVALREKLGMSEDEEISIEGVALRYQEEARIKNELFKRAEQLEQENFDLKSDIRMLKYKLSKLDDSAVVTRDTIDAEIKSSDFQKTAATNWSMDHEIYVLRHQNELAELHENVRIVIVENEALRKGMHEILDSIRDQDGKSIVEVHSDTLERLLEALDVRHIAGWYHPAMRLQERLNVVQGSNSELRTQLKHMRKEIQKRDSILRRLNTKSESKNSGLSAEESDNEDVMVYVSEMQRIQEDYRNELEKWQQERETLTKDTNDLKEVNETLTARLAIFEVDLKAIADGEDETKVALVSRTKECAESAVALIISNRKIRIMEELLNRESAKIYNIQKETFASESTYKKLIADMEKRNEMMDSSLQTLQNNLSNSVTKVEFDQLKEKYSEANLRLRSLYELHFTMIDDGTNEVSKEQSRIGEDNTQDQSLGEIYDETKQQKTSNRSNIDEMRTINSDLQKQLIQLQKLLADKLQSPKREPTENKIIELQEEIKKCRIENENLLMSLTISRDEAQMYYTINSLKILEVDNLRHQILDLQAVSEDKETIARLGFELNSCKAAEMEINRRKTQLENEIVQLQNNLQTANDKYNEAQLQLDNFRRQCDSKCRNYIDVINFLQHQYCGSTSITSLQRFELMLKKSTNDRAQIDSQLNEVKDCNEKAKVAQETLTNRLEIVDRLKDILEQQIGSADLDNLMHRFSENSQSTLNEYRLKRRTAQLESEFKIMMDKLIEYELTIATMECDMVNIQRTWKNKIEASPTTINPQPERETPIVTHNKRSVSVEAHVECHSVQVQTDPYEPVTIPEVVSVIPEPAKAERIIPQSHENTESNDTTVSFLRDQLNHALVLASDRSAKLIKYESQITEYEAKIIALDKTIIEKDVQLVQQNKLLEQQKASDTTTPSDVEGTDSVAFKSTINSLQKIINQKEETIARYQMLLKEEREEHGKIASQLQEEINNLRFEIATMKKQLELAESQRIINEIPERDIPRVISSNDLKKDQKVDIEVAEKIVRLNEQVSTLEANLHIANELGERWRRLADERLSNMDQMRERLEAQHKNELDSYRLELDKWQSETAALRQQLSENRMKLAKGNISLSKELQERDNKIEELTMLNQQLNGDLEMMESMGQLQPQISAHSSCVTAKMQELTQTLGRHDSSSHGQSEMDFLRRQLKAIMEKEKMYKEQVADLRQQLSRRYMAEKTEEKRVSQREAQLERKLKNMEEELNKARIQLDREYRNQEAKRVKTAEELSLWEKQKKWQHIAEKLKKELKDKIDEYKKLNASYDKLKSIVSCMEREKWYLRSKIRSENDGVIGGLSARPDLNVKIVEDLQKECQTLRDRISELTDRLENEDNHQLMIQIEKQKRRIVALEAVTEGNTFVVDQLEKLESAKCNLEKANIKLESENFELRMDIEKLNSDTPRLKEKVEHLEKYVELLKVEKSSESSSRSSDKDHEQGSKKSVSELERTVFVLKRIVEKLQVENKRLRINSKNNHRIIKSTSTPVSKMHIADNDSDLKKQYEQARKRVIALETDLQLADQRIGMLTIARRDDDNADEIGVLKQQLAHKSELLDKVKQLLTRAAINEKALRQRIQQIELKQTLSTISECLIPSPINQR